MFTFRSQPEGGILDDKRYFCLHQPDSAKKSGLVYIFQSYIDLETASERLAPRKLWLRDWFI